MKPPVYKLKKTELVWLNANKCKHGHTYLEHYNCFLKENPNQNRIGFFDIEVSNLKANVGLLLCYCIKDFGSDEIIEGRITPKDLRSDKLDEKVVRKCVSDLNKFDRIVTYFGCVTPGHRILTADLRWVPVETLKPGDRLYGFEEEATPNCKRHIRASEVINNIPIKKQCSRIVFVDGSTIVATNDHLWLVKRAGAWTWKKTSELLHFKSKPLMQQVMPTWESDSSFDAGYLSAIIDGEGCISQSLKKGRREKNFMITITQQVGCVLDKIIETLARLGIQYTVRAYDSSQPHMRCITIVGSRQEKLRLLGQIRPAKLGSLDIDVLGGLTRYSTKEIASIEPVGEQVVCGLETSTKTYLVEGFGSHNTGFDIPYIRSKAVHCGIDFPCYGEMLHTDLYYIVRNKFKLTRSSLKVATQYLLGDTNKTEIDWKTWIRAGLGHQPSLDYVLEHCRMDVVDTQRLYEKIMGFKKETDLSI